ncbi:MAG: hypothetical protein KGJ79_03930 [Alphaproteobacteria bacterium]|nr:hypothetical protein [Alphaproteobacteria bacterium]MDE2495195.1 hypothetical protein [Alphaproteobacteria bacterium]
MADTSFVGESAATLAAILARLKADEGARKRTWWRGAAIIAVIVLHVAFFYVLVLSEWHPSLQAMRAEEAPILWLLLPRAPGAPQITQERKREQPSSDIYKFYTLPITPPPPAPNAINPALALGQALACGASSFEYLTPEGRAQCKRVPWHFSFDKDGTIVLDAVPRQVVQEKPRNSDIMAHERNTAPDCPKYVDPNAPCLSAITGLKP